ncbi:hypothetical protein SLE2022_393230 [Rubroshorea leprosula]
MAKGRRLTTSRSDRFLGSYGNGYAAGESSTEGIELGEEEVWSMEHDVSDRNDSVGNNSQGEWSPVESNESASTGSRRNRRVHRSDRNVGGLSLAFDDSSTSSSKIVRQVRSHEGVAVTPRGQHHMATSAPVNVPDWSKIYRVDSVDSMHDSDDGCDDDDDSVMVPPHEYLARSKRSGGASVFEGVGRTLKGRDLRRVRDAVWNQTGFDG